MEFALAKGYTSAGSSRAGFSMVEVVLSLLIASIGIMAVLALFPAGLDQGRKADDDSRAALFAEQVLNGIRARAAAGWTHSLTDNLPPPLLVEGMWVTNEMSLAVSATDSFKTNNYVAFTGMLSGEGRGLSIPDHTIRYRLREFTNSNPRIRSVYLEVLPGAFGGTQTNHFYIEVLNAGG